MHQKSHSLNSGTGRGSCRDDCTKYWFPRVPQLKDDYIFNHLTFVLYIIPNKFGFDISWSSQCFLVNQ